MKISTAVKYYGSQTALADALNISKAAVTLWKQKGNLVPRGKAFELEVITNGKLKVNRRLYR